MSFLDGIFARDFFWNGVLQRLAPADFLDGFSFAYNPATNRIEITATGGGGGGGGVVSSIVADDSATNFAGSYSTLFAPFSVSSVVLSGNSDFTNPQDLRLTCVTPGWYMAEALLSLDSGSGLIAGQFGIAVNGDLEAVATSPDASSWRLNVAGDIRTFPARRLLLLAVDDYVEPVIVVPGGVSGAQALKLQMTLAFQGAP